MRTLRWSPPASSPRAQGLTLGPGKASFCFSFTVSSMYPEQVPICEGGSGAPSWGTRGCKRGGVKKATSALVRRGRGRRGPGPERAGVRRTKRTWGSGLAHLWGKLLEVQADPRQLQQLVQERGGLVHVHRGGLARVPHGLVTVL